MRIQILINIQLDNLQLIFIKYLMKNQIRFPNIKSSGPVINNIYHVINNLQDYSLHKNKYLKKTNPIISKSHIFSQSKSPKNKDQIERSRYQKYFTNTKKIRNKKQKNDAFKQSVIINKSNNYSNYYIKLEKTYNYKYLIRQFYIKKYSHLQLMRSHSSQQQAPIIKSIKSFRKNLRSQNTSKIQSELQQRTDIKPWDNQIQFQLF